jgi:hypothetical protein
MVSDKKTSGFAITALVMGILSFIGGLVFGALSAILAIIFGIISLHKIKKGILKGKALAWAGIIISILYFIIYIAQFIYALIAWGNAF